MPDFRKTIESHVPVLTDGGVETRVMFETDIPMDPDVQVAAMTEDRESRTALKDIYGGYVKAARDFDLPVIIGTPTFRASANFVARAGRPAKDIGELNRRAVELHLEVRSESGHENTFIAGVIGPSGDAYLPGEALGIEPAQEYHRDQAEVLAGAGVDFLFAPTFPSVKEAEGCCRAMAETGLPHVISYILGPDDNLLDGTPLAEAISAIDGDPDARPLYHSLSCISSNRSIVRDRAATRPARIRAPGRVQGEWFSAQNRSVDQARPSRN